MHCLYDSSYEQMDMVFNYRTTLAQLVRCASLMVGGILGVYPEEVALPSMVILVK